MAQPGAPEGPGTPRGQDDAQASQRQPIPFGSVEQLFAFLILRGQTTVTQAAYRTLQLFYNAKMTALCGASRRDVRLPSLEAMRTHIAPRVRQAWALVVQPVHVAADGHTAQLSVGVILPSEHVKRDFAFRDTFRLFFLDG